MNKVRLLLVAMLVGSAFALTGCGKKSEPSEPTTEHNENDGHDHAAHDDHEGHNH
jgi:ABC-type Zn2+ transport system substrate-binding protein/surface adhesin